MEKKHNNWRTENENYNNNRDQGQKNNYNRDYNNRAMNALALNKGNRQNQKFSYCFRTNHIDKDCYYKPMNTQITNNNNNGRAYRNQNNVNQKKK